jgi:RNA polymerase II-associated factor 1
VSIAATLYPRKVNALHSKLDLLVRVRYSNPLPAPPCPPKLLDIPTNPMRYARPEFLDALANDTSLPMIVDAECGMPLDLGRWESLWEEDADDSGECTPDCSCVRVQALISMLQALNPDPNNLPKLDPMDAFLLTDPSTTPSSYVNGGHTTTGTTTSVTPSPAYVPWLRKTEYISREGVQRTSAQEPYVHITHTWYSTPTDFLFVTRKHVMSAPIDVSRGAQIRDIEASFDACNEGFSLLSLRHPNKPNVTAIESYEIFPDADIWANAYDLFRFSERPGERPVDVRSPFRVWPVCELMCNCM